MPCVIGARSKRCSAPSAAVAVKRRAVLERTAGNQATLRRYALVQRDTTDADPKPDPKPLIPLGKDWKLDPSGSHPGAPKPWDQPGAAGSSAAGGSLEDINKGYHALFDKKPPAGLNKDFKMPPCSVLESADSTSATKKYKSFQSYDTMRRLYHSPLTKDPWPPLTPEQYRLAIDACSAQAPPKPAVPAPPPQPPAAQIAPPASSAPAPSGR